MTFSDSASPPCPCSPSVSAERADDRARALPSGIGCCGEWAKTEADCPGGRSEGTKKGRGKGSRKRGRTLALSSWPASLSPLCRRTTDTGRADADSMSETCLAPAPGLGRFQINPILDPSVHPSCVQSESLSRKHKPHSKQRRCSSLSSFLSPPSPPLAIFNMMRVRGNDSQ